jgi:S-adenosylmethionine decarboxylase
MFGPHLTLDLYYCSKDKLADTAFIFKILDELPDLIGMHKISSPEIVNYNGNPESFDKGGISAFVLIAESHITIHTFVKQQFASIDIFSCKDFDVEKAESYIVKKFEPKKVEKHLIYRGMEFPKEVEKAKDIVRQSRKRISISS